MVVACRQPLGEPVVMQKILRKSQYWHKHGHPVATRGEYARIRREQDQRAVRIRKNAAVYESVETLFRSTGPVANRKRGKAWKRTKWK